MTAYELARTLLKGPDVMVTRRGYEGGVVEVTQVYPPATLLLHVLRSPYYGPHDYDRGDYSDTVAQITTAIHLA